jgi:hypothetical protein
VVVTVTGSCSFSTGVDDLVSFLFLESGAHFECGSVLLGLNSFVACDGDATVASSLDFIAGGSLVGGMFDLSGLCCRLESCCSAPRWPGVDYTRSLAGGRLTLQADVVQFTGSLIFNGALIVTVLLNASDATIVLARGTQDFLQLQRPVTSTSSFSLVAPLSLDDFFPPLDWCFQPMPACMFVDSTAFGAAPCLVGSGSGLGIVVLSGDQCVCACQSPLVCSPANLCVCRVSSVSRFVL